MSGPSYRVPAASWDDIAELTSKWRGTLGLDSTPHFPIAHVLEIVLEKHFEGFVFDVAERSDMLGGAEGLTAPDGSFICLRSDVYEAMLKGDGRARFTAAHELGHFSLHTDVVLARVGPGERVPAYQESEAQANQFAAELLMPRQMIFIGDSVPDLTRRFGVSQTAAKHRLDFLSNKGLLNEKRTTLEGGPFSIL